MKRYLKNGRPDEKKEVLDSSDKKIIMPDIGREYRNIKEVQEYLKDLRKVYKQGSAVLPLEDNELDSNGNDCSRDSFTKSGIFK